MTTADVTDIEQARAKREANEPHRLLRFRCRACNHGADALVLSVAHHAADVERLVCPKCGAFDSETSDAEVP